MIFSKRRQVFKTARRLLHDARYLRNMRGDITEQKRIDSLRAAETKLREALEKKDTAEVETQSKMLADAMERFAPRRPFAAIRENLEIIVVAVAVAMAFRTYFIQPFKIPTGSMQPTLYGIHYKPLEKPALRHRFPLSLLNWLVFGEWYVEVHAKSSGTVRPLFSGLPQPTGVVSLDVGGARQSYTNLCHHYELGQEVVAGQLLASGLKVSGDHIFVNKLAWNFRRPRRGEIVVFDTSGIPKIAQGTFYIKRMVGLPGDALSIRQPYIYNHGKKLEPEPPYHRGIQRIQQQKRLYRQGYQLPAPHAPDPVLRTPQNVITLGPDDFFALGDNTGSSLDGRYWGKLPRKNLVGPAFLVYWPFSRERWCWPLRFVPKLGPAD